MKNLILGFITFCLLLVTFSALSPNVSAQNKKDMKKAEKLYEQGRRSYLKNDFQGAIKFYSEAIALVNNYPEAHFWKGSAHNNLKEYDIALEEINKAVSQGYNKPSDVYPLRGYLNYTQKKYDEALSDLNKAIELQPNNIFLKAYLADTYYAKQSYQDALNIYKVIVEKIPNNGNTYYTMADSYYNLGDTAGQKEMAEKAVQKGTQYMAESYLLIGKANQKERKYVEAAEMYEKAIGLKKDSYELYRNLSDVYRNLNKFNEAIKISKKALEIFPRDGNLYTDISWYYSLADQYTESIGQAQIAISLLPDKFQAYTYLCRGYNDIKEYKKAIVACNDALKLNPNDGETNFYLGYANDASGKPDVAATYYKKAVTGLIEFTERYPDFADGYYLLGNAYASTGEREKAIASYNRSLELSPKFKKARFNLGIVYIQKGDLVSAEFQYNALLDIDKIQAEKLKAVFPKKN
jgi:tetratricopeptide (TPR) repeat protein